MRITVQTGTSAALERWASWVATGAGVGYFPVVPGTAGSLVGLSLFLLLRNLSPLDYGLLLVFLFPVGVYTAGLSESFLGRKDAGQIVIDEIYAMLLVPALLPVSWLWWIAGFLLFRLFDIAKPFPIRSFEKLPGGWGIMMDDLSAALYTVLLLRLAEQITRWAV